MPDRTDHLIICAMITPGARVLDLGCGDGALMSLLSRDKKASVQGIELDDEAVHRCVERGLTVFQGNIESGLADYPDGCFDDVILNQCMQEVKAVDFVIDECLRVGKRVIVGFPNFAHLSSRWSLFFRGRTPVTPSMPHPWHVTPSVRFLTIRDFEEYCRHKGLRIKEVVYLGAKGTLVVLPNLRAQTALYVVQAPKAGDTS